jgi:hypothetical protein
MNDGKTENADLLSPSQLQYQKIKSFSIKKEVSHVQSWLKGEKQLSCIPVL